MISNREATSYMQCAGVAAREFNKRVRAVIELGPEPAFYVERLALVYELCQQAKAIFRTHTMLLQGLMDDIPGGGGSSPCPEKPSTPSPDGNAQSLPSSSSTPPISAIRASLGQAYRDSQALPVFRRAGPSWPGLLLSVEAGSNVFKALGGPTSSPKANGGSRPAT